jgi:general secretion pathway protein G
MAPFHHRRRGFTLIEMMIVAVITGILAALAIPNYTRIRDRAMVARAIGDIDAIQFDLQEYVLRNGSLPTTLAGIDRAGLEDPWGNPYQYLPIAGSGKGGFRKDRFLVPINSDYDLYSMGADGASQGPLSAKASQDDIVRANDGGFVGLAKDF